MSRRIALWALCVGLCGPTAIGQESAPPAPAPITEDRYHDADRLPSETAAAIDVAATAMLARSHAPGVSLAVVVRGQIVLAAGYGWADVEQQRPATAQTSYAWASISKPVTATIAMQLVDAGALELDGDVRRWVPSWPEHAEGVITPRHLLTHQSGISHYGRGRLAYSDLHRYPDCTAGLAKFRDAPLLFAPGTRTRYSTFAFTLLGCACEGAGGASFPELLRTRIFEPAHMATARTDDPYAIIPNRARGYVRGTDGTIAHAEFHNPSYKIPGGGIRGSVVDLARFAIASMDGTLLPAPTFATMCTAATLADGTATSRGLGWQLSRKLGRADVGVTLVTHSGGQAGVSTWCVLWPDARFAMAICCNCEKQGGAIVGLSQQIWEAVRPVVPADTPK